MATWFVHSYSLKNRLDKLREQRASLERVIDVHEDFAHSLGPIKYQTTEEHYAAEATEAEEFNKQMEAMLEADAKRVSCDVLHC